jgi:hypothetical protein
MRLMLCKPNEACAWPSRTTSAYCLKHNTGRRSSLKHYNVVAHFSSFLDGSRILLRCFRVVPNISPEPEPLIDKRAPASPSLFAVIEYGHAAPALCVPLNDILRGCDTALFGNSFLSSEVYLE